MIAKRKYIYLQGNYGKAEEIVTKITKKGEKTEKGEEKQPLLEASDDELEVEVISPSTTLLDKSVTMNQRPESTEYDR